MKPTTRKEIVKKLSKELNISADDIDDIIYSYYNYILSLVNSLEHTRIFITGLGTLRFRLSKAVKYVNDADRIVASLERKKDTDYTRNNIKNLKIRKVKMQGLIEKIYQEKEEKRNKKIERNEFIKRLESERRDFRGDNE